LTRKKQDALPKKAHSKNKKVALPKMAVANPFIVKLKIARNTNKKAKVHECIIDKDKAKPFEMVFARLEKRKLEKRRMLLQKKTINSSIKKTNIMQLRNHVDINYDDEDADDYNEVDDEDVGKDDEVDDEFKDDEVEDVVEDEVKDVVKDVVGGHDEVGDEDEVKDEVRNLVGSHDEVADETVNNNKKVVSSKMVVPTGVTNHW